MLGSEPVWSTTGAEPVRMLTVELRTEGSPQNLESIMLGMVCHMLIERLPMWGRLEALEQLAQIQAFHAAPAPPISAPSLPPATTTGRFAGVVERRIPAIDEG